VNRLDFDLSGVAQKDRGGAEKFSRSKPVASRHRLLRFKAKSANLAAIHRQGERSGCVWQLPRPGSRRACICELREILVARTQVDKGGLGGHGAELMHHREVVPNPPNVLLRWGGLGGGGGRHHPTYPTTLCNSKLNFGGFLFHALLE
jgi:hypothetical protein